MATFCELPVEIISTILSFLDPDVLGQVCLASQIFFTAGWHSDFVWAAIARRRGLTKSDEEKWFDIVKNAASVKFVPCDWVDISAKNRRVTWKSDVSATVFVFPPVSSGVWRGLFQFDSAPDSHPDDFAVGWSSTGVLPNDYLGNDRTSIDWNCCGELFGCAARCDSQSPDRAEEDGGDADPEDDSQNPHVEPFQLGDIVAVELDMVIHQARFFKGPDRDHLAPVGTAPFPASWTKCHLGPGHILASRRCLDEEETFAGSAKAPWLDLAGLADLDVLCMVWILEGCHVTDGAEMIGGHGDEHDDEGEIEGDNLAGMNIFYGQFEPNSLRDDPSSQTLVSPPPSDGTLPPNPTPHNDTLAPSASAVPIPVPSGEGAPPSEPLEAPASATSSVPVPPSSTPAASDASGPTPSPSPAPSSSPDGPQGFSTVPLDFAEEANAARKRAHKYEEDHSMASWALHKKHMFILTSAAKPVFSRWGDEDKLSGFFCVLQALVSFTNSHHDDCLRSIVAGDHTFVFYIEDPLYLVAVARTGESEMQLRIQLHFLMSEMLSILSSSFKNRLKKQPNFDLRKLLGGTEMNITNYIRRMDRDPNLLILLNFVHSPALQRQQESFAPICLPKFAPKGILQSYVRYFDTATFGPNTCLLLITDQIDQNMFFALQQYALRNPSKNPPMLRLREELIRAPSYALSALIYQQQQLQTPQLRHFLYCSNAHRQWTGPALEVPTAGKAPPPGSPLACSPPPSHAHPRTHPAPVPAQAPYNSKESQRRLFRLYEGLHSRMWSDRMYACNHSQVPALTRPHT
ncbi:putative vacuolar fusion protein MON1 A [Paratrimastix pyriformis]|uniref:Vacuolar fusion protein MON1 A n=1 Tax=Paratrimastix pyriformis TaxID=342808 RepID=A0ABQ8UXI4_9EUKA|nr:putative vacuolar fusion protein MON1 A [Paratrimastix pyriformis]